MKTGKIILIAVLVLAAIAGAGFFGLKYGVGLMQNGLVANYPTVKNIVNGAATEVDSIAVINLTKADDEALFNYIKGDSKSDTVQFSIPYYGRYAVDLSFRNFRVFRNDDGAVEVWLPACMLRYCELKFDGLVVNEKPSAAVFKSENASDIRKKLYAYLIPVIEKHKANQKAARLTVTKALMFYFMPYKLDLKVYIANNQQQLPIVPGVNQTVDEAIKEAFNP
jgi:hypothetical protein